MNASDILKYGHETVLQAVDGLPEAEWVKGGVCGVWSVKDVVAHLTSAELIIVDALMTLVGGGTTPHLDAFNRKEPDLNEREVALRRDWPVARVLAEYTETAERVMTLAARVPPETCRRAGALPWYGEEYSLDDFLVYMAYGHKCEHCAQIAVFRDRLKARA